MKKPDKPKPIRHSGAKPLGWKRETRVGFVLPRLNDPQGQTQAIGFFAPGDYDYWSDEDRRK